MNWVRRHLRRKSLENQLDMEVRFHIDQHTDELIARGYTPMEARRQALVAFGGAEPIKEDCRDARGTRWLEDLLQDVRYGFRSLQRKPGFAVVALLTLVLGTGVTSLMFTVINGVLLQPLPYADADRLIVLPSDGCARSSRAVC